MNVNFTHYFGLIDLAGELYRSQTEEVLCIS